ncbi:Arabinofuranosyltransferase AftA [Corynebacterium capitovis DSM 44611]|uniref:arabinofuranosyltransferase n=1 Tax=Corynebacterium capitovis TaxID=131081 RepID=UPI000378CCAD|nr:arabinofuranosyltransferase [Corynebacterium capitovis]WKD56656.1 Arabinofuranosyltransferase AftA [Corynebacterium capitovis DSM 44611]
MRFLSRVATAPLAGGLLTLLCWRVLHALTLPAANTSTVLWALSTACTLLVLGAAAGALWWRRGWVSEAVLTLAPAGLIVTTLGIPLAVTKLYLDGVQVDQSFRTQFLSRMTQSLGNHDMNFADLPSFYPVGWFWLGGRLANLLGLAGWEAFQPWALVSLAAAASALVPVWQRITGSLPTAAVIAFATTAVILAEAPYEPYAAIVAMFAPAAAAVAFRAASGSWPATAALAVYLGVSATFYTLFTALSALTVIVASLIVFFSAGRKLTPLVHLVAAGAGAALIALLSWGPYLLERAFGGYDARSTANHYLPDDGTVFPLPFHSVPIALLALVGVAYLIRRSHTAAARGLTVALAVCFVWCFASMVTPLLGTSLLGFRVAIVVDLLFVTAGVLGLREVGSWRGWLASTAAIAAAVGVFAYAQDIPRASEDPIKQAYSATDGNGERADRQDPDDEQYYPAIVDYLQRRGYEPGQAVVSTDEVHFLSYNPYYGFNGMTSHYSNPLAEFSQRSDLISAWGETSYDDPGALTDEVDSAPWRAPDAFIFRAEEDDEGAETWQTHVSYDIFPNLPNVKYVAVDFNPAAFDTSEWDHDKIGPFVVVARK